MGQVSQINDFFIRWLIGQKGHEALLLNFVNAFMVDAGLDKFTEVEIINPYNLKDSKEEHQSIVDVKATMDNGEVVIIEIQVRTDKQFADRALYYWAKNYTKLEEKRIEYKSLKPIICINILNFNIDDEYDYAHTSYDIRCRETGRLLTDKFLMHFLELPKFINNVKSSDLIGWCKFLTSKNLEEDIVNILKENPVLESAVNHYKRFSLDKDLLTEYEKREMYLRQQADLIEQGREEGREEGESLGLKKGQQKEKIEIARNMLAMNMSVEMIMQATGLTAVEIEEIKSEM